MGKCFEIRNGSVHGGITLRWGQIEVGEEGRGRSRTIVNPPPGAVVRDSHLLEVPGPATVVLVRDQSGMRGSWRLAEYATGRCPRDGQPADDYPRCSVCQAWCGDDPAPDHNLVPAADLGPGDLGKLIAKGRRAQGAAGRAGGGPEYLIALRPGARFSIRRWGRLYGFPPVLNVEVTDGGLDIRDAWAGIRAAEAEAAWEL